MELPRANTSPLPHAVDAVDAADVPRSASLGSATPARGGGGFLQMGTFLYSLPSGYVKIAIENDHL